MDQLSASGGDRWIYDMASQWLDMGAYVTLFHLTGRIEFAPLKPPPGVRVAGGVDGRRRLRYCLPRLAFALYRESHRHDVVLTGTSGMSTVAGFAAARLTRRRMVAYSQGLADESLQIYQSNERLRRVIRHVLPRADAVFCVSPESARAARRLDVSLERIAEVRTGISLDDVKRRARAHCLPARPYIVGVGTLEPRKGYDLLLQAYRKMLDRGARVELVLVGPDGGDRGRLDSLAHELGVSDCVHFVGHVEDAVPYIAAASVLVHPARSETVGLVLLEALAVGTPVVANDCAAGGPRLVLDDGRFGRLVNALDADEFADAVLDQLSQVEGRTVRAECVEQHLLRHFSAQVSAQRALALLGQLAAGGTVAPRPL